jgi:hypothetical protein
VECWYCTVGGASLHSHVNSSMEWTFGTLETRLKQGYWGPLPILDLISPLNQLGIRDQWDCDGLHCDGDCDLDLVELFPGNILRTEVRPFKTQNTKHKTPKEYVGCATQSHLLSRPQEKRQFREWLCGSNFTLVQKRLTTSPLPVHLTKQPSKRRSRTSTKWFYKRSGHLGESFQKNHKTPNKRNLFPQLKKTTAIIHQSESDQFKRALG